MLPYDAADSHREGLTATWGKRRERGQPCAVTDRLALHCTRVVHALEVTPLLRLDRALGAFEQPARQEER